MDNNLQLDEIHKEIDLIQSCITRMAQNSFMIKGWFVSIYAVILALLPEKFNIVLICVILLVVNIVFWYLDAFFLQMEKKYRKMYNWVLDERPKGNKELLYQLSPLAFADKINKVETIGQVMVSKTLRYFYFLPLLIVLIVFLFNILPLIQQIISCISLAS